MSDERESRRDIGASSCVACGGVPVDPVRPYVGLGDFCRTCFREEDRRSEALECGFPSSFLLASFAPDPARELLELAGVKARRQRSTTAEEFVGRHFGELKVLGIARRTRGDGRVVVCLRIRCSCGAEYLAGASGFRKRQQRQCRACSGIARRRSQAKTLIGDETILQVARRLGLTHQAIRLRLHRGWALHELGAPRRGRAQPGRKAA